MINLKEIYLQIRVYAEDISSSKKGLTSFLLTLLILIPTQTLSWGGWSPQILSWPPLNGLTQFFRASNNGATAHKAVPVQSKQGFIEGLGDAVVGGAVSRIKKETFATARELIDNPTAPVSETTRDLGKVGARMGVAAAQAGIQAMENDPKAIEAAGRMARKAVAPVLHESVERVKEIMQQATSELKVVSKDISDHFDTSTNILLERGVKSVAVGAAIILTAIIMYKISNKYINKNFFEPKLIEKQSESEWIDWLLGSLRYCLPSFIVKKNNKFHLAHHMVVDKKCAEELFYLINLIASINKNGGQFENALLWGPPGTGKTLFAKLLAENSDMEFAFIPAANVSQFLNAGTAVEELNKLFTWAKGSKGKMILFFDECETFLADRVTLSIEGQNALNSFLAHTGEPSENYMIICATNRPELLDKAALSRLGLSLEIPLPGLQERKEQLIMHINKLFGSQKNKIKIHYAYLLNPDIVGALAEKLEGASGRSIQKLVNRILQLARTLKKQSIDQEIVDKALAYGKNDERLRHRVEE